jgi:hypothetical protein
MFGNIKWLVPAVAVALPLTAFAQGNDAAYCKALADKYQAFIVNMQGHSEQAGSIDGNLAVEQCKQGNSKDAIPVLEQKLNDAKIPLPHHS